MIYRSAEGDKRRARRSFWTRLAVLLGILMAAPFFFRDTPRLVTVVLERVGPASAPTDVSVGIGRREWIKPGMIPVVTFDRDIIFMHDGPAERTVWLAQGEFMVFAEDQEHGAVRYPIAIAGDNRIVIRFDGSKARPFSL